MACLNDPHQAARVQRAQPDVAQVQAGDHDLPRRPRANGTQEPIQEERVGLAEGRGGVRGAGGGRGVFGRWRTAQARSIRPDAALGAGSESLSAGTCARACMTTAGAWASSAFLSHPHTLRPSITRSGGQSCASTIVGSRWKRPSAPLWPSDPERDRCCLAASVAWSLRARSTSEMAASVERPACCSCTLAIIRRVTASTMRCMLGAETLSSDVTMSPSARIPEHAVMSSSDCEGGRTEGCESESERGGMWWSARTTAWTAPASTATNTSLVAATAASTLHPEHCTQRSSSCAPSQCATMPSITVAKPPHSTSARATSSEHVRSSSLSASPPAKSTLRLLCVACMRPTTTRTAAQKRAA
eukprot:1829579-Rhodomonas_salina.1